MNDARLKELLEKSDVGTITPEETLELLKYLNSAILELKNTLEK